MNNLAINNPNREMVWTINKTTTTTNNSNKNKEPVRVKELVEKTFQRLSLQLLEKVNQLESELGQLKTENKNLQKRLNELDIA